MALSSTTRDARAKHTKKKCVACVRHYPHLAVSSQIFHHCIISYPEIGDSCFRCAIWAFKQQLTLKVRARDFMKMTKEGRFS